jgi:hypothetical protein
MEISVHVINPGRLVVFLVGDYESYLHAASNKKKNNMII